MDIPKYEQREERADLAYWLTAGGANWRWGFPGEVILDGHEGKPGMHIIRFRQDDGSWGRFQLRNKDCLGGYYPVEDQ